MKSNLFGTDGIRACVGAPPFTGAHFQQLGTALACWAQKRYGPTPRILLAHDTRLSCWLLKAALKQDYLLNR